MNAKLAALLIRSNANMIHALFMCEKNNHVRRGGGPVVHRDQEFLDLITRTIELAEQAESLGETEGTVTHNVEMGVAIQKAAEAGADAGFRQVAKGSPIMPISPAHEVKLDRNSLIGRTYRGESSSNPGQMYIAVIVNTSRSYNGMTMQEDLYVNTDVTEVNGSAVTGFPRSMSFAQLEKEFRGWM